jgi:hypothetical protein
VLGSLLFVAVEVLFIYLMSFTKALMRLGMSETAAFWTGAYLSCVAIIALFAVFMVKSAGARSVLLLFIVAVVFVPIYEFKRQIEIWFAGFI